MVQPGSSRCWRRCEGPRHVRRLCTVSLISVLYRARRAGAGHGQGAAALSEHMTEASQVLKAASVPRNALDKSGQGQLLGLSAVCPDLLCSALLVFTRVVLVPRGVASAATNDLFTRHRAVALIAGGR